jgi:hypothetical protein
MSYSTPGYLIPYVLTGTLAVFAAVFYGLNGALTRAKWADRERRRAIWQIMGPLTAWLVAALLLSWSGYYRGTASGMPTIQYGVLIPIIAGVALFWRWPLLARVIEAVPQEWILNLQFYRALGVIFLVLFAAGRLPGEFALPAGLGDVAVGLLAPLVAIAYARRLHNAEGFVRLWNWFGLADLAVALTTGFLTSPSRFQMMAFARPNVLIDAFPLAMIPVFLVPLSILLHFASLYKLRRAHEAGHIPSPLLAAGRS